MHPGGEGCYLPDPERGHRAFGHPWICACGIKWYWDQSKQKWTFHRFHEGRDPSNGRSCAIHKPGQPCNSICSGLAAR